MHNYTERFLLSLTVRGKSGTEMLHTRGYLGSDLGSYAASLVLRLMRAGFKLQ